jgi:transcriptional regulator with XRE-family HTH domain
MAHSPSAYRRRLGRALRSLRESADLTGEGAAAAAERSASWLSRIESGRAALRLRELRDLLDHYGMTDPDVRADLERMANGGRQRDWWTAYTDKLFPSFARFMGLESEATAILTFEDHAIPGLLQSPSYVRALFRLAVPPTDDDVIDAMVEFRVRRQEVLRDEERPHFTVVLDEAVLHRRFGGPEVAREQFTFLLDAIDRELVEFHILESGRERMPLHAFTVLRFEDDPTVAHIDTLTGGVFEEGPSVTEKYEEIFSYLCDIALDPPASRRVIDTARKNLT